MIHTHVDDGRAAVTKDYDEDSAALWFKRNKRILATVCEVFCISDFKHKPRVLDLSEPSHTEHRTGTYDQLFVTNTEAG